MCVPPRLSARALGLAGLVLSLASVARAQEAGAPDGIDDPKVQRRLGSRIDLPGALAAPAVEAPVTAPASDFASGPSASLEKRPSGPTPPAPRVPHVKLAYRFLNLVQIGPGPAESVGGSETFHVVSLDFYPVSSFWRFGLSTQYGWEAGTFRANGDAFIAQSLSLGGQIPGPVFTPFFEAYAGGGLMQRMHDELSLTSPATAYGQFGVDAGTEMFVAQYAYFSAAIGFVHASNLWARKDEFGAISGQSLSTNTFTFKLGFGL